MAASGLLSGRLLRVAVGATVVTWACAGLAFANPSTTGPAPIALRLLVRGAGCPTAAEVADVLAAASGRFAVSLDDARGKALPVALLDEGAGYVVFSGKDARTFSDPSRRCLERARAAAVFITLSLDPPAARALHADVSLDELLAAGVANRPAQSVAPPSMPVTCPSCPPPPSCPPASTTQSVTVDSPRFRARLGFLGLVEGAPGQSGGPAAAGARIEAVLDWRGLGLVLGLGGTAPAPLDNSGVHFGLARLTADAGFVAVLRRGVFEGALAAGVAGVVDLINDEGPQASATVTRAEVAARLAATGAFWLSPQLGLSASVYTIVSVDPVALRTFAGDSVGQTPRAWLGGTLGVVWRIR